MTRLMPSCGKFPDDRQRKPALWSVPLRSRSQPDGPARWSSSDRVLFLSQCGNLTHTVRLDQNPYPLLAPDALVGDDLVTARKLHEEDRNHNPRFFASDSGTGYLCAPAVPYFEISGRTRDRITQIIEARGARGGECNA